MQATTFGAIVYYPSGINAPHFDGESGEQWQMTGEAFKQAAELNEIHLDFSLQDEDVLHFTDEPTIDEPTSSRPKLGNTLPEQLIYLLGSPSIWGRSDAWLAMIFDATQHGLAAEDIESAGFAKPFAALVEKVKAAVTKAS